MARILYKTDWFEEIASQAHYEAEFENVLQREAARLFESYYFIPFKTPVVSEFDADVRKPDFALIHKDYRSWWVVEVELGHHSFEGHVLPQVRTLTRAKYGKVEVDYLCARNSALKKEKVLEMFKGKQPSVLVIVNSREDEWAEQLRPFGAKVLFCQLFRSNLNQYLLHLDGEYPTENNEVITTCECSGMIHRMMEIHSPTQLPLQKGDRILLYHEGRASEWERIDTAGRVILHAVRGHSLRPGKRYIIIRQGDGTFAITQSDKANT